MTDAQMKRKADTIAAQNCTRICCPQGAADIFAAMREAKASGYREGKLCAEMDALNARESDEHRSHPAIAV